MEKFVIYGFSLLFPFFFLNITSDILTINKLYLVFLTALMLILASTVKIVLSRKISWKKNPLDLPIILFIFSIVISIIFSSSNKIGAVMNPYFGLMPILGLGVFYFYLSKLSQQNKQIIVKIFAILGAIASIISLLIFSNLIKFTNISLGFPVGSNLDLIIFLGFAVIVQFFAIFVKKETEKYYFVIPFIITLGGFFTALYGLIKSNPIFPPFDVSWFSTIEILKSLKTALLGFGVGNFSTVFTQVKNVGFNQLNFWQLNGFNLSRSTILHITTETGLIGLFAFIAIALVFLKTAFKQSNKFLISLFLYLLISLFLLPPSLMIFFLLFITLGLAESDQKSASVDLSELPVIYLGIIFINLLVVGGLGYFFGRTYLAEIYYKKYLVSINKNEGKKAYDSLRQAIITNPTDERYLMSYSQINYAIANNLASKQKDKITKDDEQIISQAIQASINYAKSVLSLNPKRADYWENLGSIYRNIIPVVKGANIWAIASYQRAVVFDPQNPRLRLNLGGIYYLMGKYDDAIRFFEQAASLKPDWPNAHYNLAWSYYQKKDYQKATLTMQNVLNLLEKEKNKTDYEKVKKELEQFKLQLPQEVTSASDSSELSLPKQPDNQLEPKINLPNEASPEAK